LAEPSLLLPRPGLELVKSGVEHGGFSVHAGVTVKEGDKLGREKLCRYAARPPFAEDQIRLTGDGMVRFTLRSPAKNGQRAILLEPLRFLRRIAWLVPPPRQHQVRYHGVLAPAAKMRSPIIPRPRPKIQLAFPIENLLPERPSFRVPWARLLARYRSGNCVRARVRPPVVSSATTMVVRRSREDRNPG